MKVATILFEDGTVEVFEELDAARQRLVDLDFEKVNGAVWKDQYNTHAQLTVDVDIQQVKDEKRDRTPRIHYKHPADGGFLALCKTPSKKLSQQANDVTCGTCNKMLEASG